MPQEKILVCDDDGTIVEFCTTVLAREAYVVKGADSGEEAIRLAQEEHFAVLLIDFKMPGVNGLETFKIIREYDPELAGVLMTGHGTLPTAIDAIKIGFKGFLSKPFTYDELLFTVSEVLNQTRLEKEVIAHREANKLKDVFMCLVSHELRTPLSLVLASINLLSQMREGDADNEEKKILTILKKESCRLSKTINDLLIMSELSVQTYEHPWDSLNLSNITDNIAASLREDAQEKDITIRNLIPKQLPEVYGVRSKIIQLMINLLDNAIKFNRQGGEVTITASKEHGHLRVEIKDTGPGIPANKISTLFATPFDYLEDPMTKPSRGLGMGLSVCKKILDDHAGKIWVEASAQKGSSFIFTLPIKADKQGRLTGKENGA